MQLQLDPQDIHLLKEMAELGEVGPKVLDQGHRLERLEVEGYVSSVRRDPPELDAPPAWVYRLTIKGRAIRLHPDGEHQAYRRVRIGHTRITTATPSVPCLGDSSPC